MARPEGFEPPTPKFVAWCSIQLSYGRVAGAGLCMKRHLRVNGFDEAEVISSRYGTST